MGIWRYVNILSLDVAGGAVVCCAFFARVFGVTLLPHALIALGLTVWVIYTIDHLLDARNTKGIPATERHRFHLRHHRVLSLLVILAGCIIALEAFFLRRPVLYAGLGLAVMVIIYLFLQASLRFLKEIAGAVLYTCGVLAAPWSLMDRPLSMMERSLVIVFAMTALTNLLIFSWFDRQSDEADRHHSFATAFGDKYTKAFIVITFSITFILAAWMTWQGALTEMLILLIMNFIMLFVFLSNRHYTVDDRFRRAGDFIFFLPVVYLLLT